jgi:hypothetical protein
MFKQYFYNALGVTDASRYLLPKYFLKYFKGRGDNVSSLLWCEFRGEIVQVYDPYADVLLNTCR